MQYGSGKWDNTHQSYQLNNILLLASWRPSQFHPECLPAQIPDREIHTSQIRDRSLTHNGGKSGYAYAYHLSGRRRRCWCYVFVGTESESAILMWLLIWSSSLAWQGQSWYNYRQFCGSGHSDMLSSAIWISRWKKLCSTSNVWILHLPGHSGILIRDYVLVRSAETTTDQHVGVVKNISARPFHKSANPVNEHWNIRDLTASQWVVTSSTAPSKLSLPKV